MMKSLNEVISDLKHALQSAKDASRTYGYDLSNERYLVETSIDALKDGSVIIDITGSFEDYLHQEYGLSFPPEAKTEFLKHARKRQYNPQ